MRLDCSGLEAGLHSGRHERTVFSVVLSTEVDAVRSAVGSADLPGLELRAEQLHFTVYRKTLQLRNQIRGSAGL